MEIKRSKIDINNTLTLPPDWKGYSFNEKSNSWVKDSDLYKDEKSDLHPFCSMVHINKIAKIFENSPINENNILIIKFAADGNFAFFVEPLDGGNVNDIFILAYILVGSIDIKNYEFETKLVE